MEWRTTWGYLPVNFNTIIATLENITQRTYFWNNINGKKVRILFSNKYSDEKLVFDRVVLAIKQGEELLNATDITCNGQNKIVIEGGQEFYSDEIDFRTLAGSDLVLTCYIKEKVYVKCACANWSDGNWYTEYVTEENHILECKDVYPFMKEDIYKYTVLPGISRIEVLTDQDVKQVTLFGDSITHMSYYCNALMEYLYKKYPGKISVVNCGYGGNRILRDASFAENIPGHGKCAGPAAIKRFEDDIFHYQCPDYIFLLEGINDLMHPYFFNRMDELPKTEELIQAYKNFAKIAGKKGSQIYFSTVMPFESKEYPFGCEGEKVRNEFNGWIKEQNSSDGVFDFAGSLADCDKPFKLKDSFHIGDGLHPNQLGGEKMAKVVIKTMGW